MAALALRERRRRRREQAARAARTRQRSKIRWSHAALAVAAALAALMAAPAFAHVVACDDFYACNFGASDGPCEYPPAPGFGVACDGSPLPASSPFAAAYGGLDLGDVPAFGLRSRPRRVGLVLVDAQEEYRAFTPPRTIANMAALARAAVEQGDVPVAISGWARRYDDPAARYVNAGDRMLGVPPERTIAYTWKRDGHVPLAELATLVGGAEGASSLLQLNSTNLDLFWNFDGRGDSILAGYLAEHAVDTVVVAGLWTDACILATAIAAHNRGFDVVVASDAVATATGTGKAAIDAVQTFALVMRTAELTDYLRSGFERSRLGQYRDPSWHDGRVYQPAERYHATANHQTVTIA